MSKCFRKTRGLLLALLIVSAAIAKGAFVFAQDYSSEEGDEDAGDEYNEDAPDIYEDDEDFVYLQNGPGDQFLNLRIMPNFPMNFDDKIKVGGQITVGYGRFINTWLALNVELAFGYNPTIGGNMLTYIPITVGATFLPTAKKFEFPITMNVGMAIENYLSNTYFPGLALRGGAGCYYRINENWSAGIEGFCTYLPQWYNASGKTESNDYYIYTSASIGMKYHF